eukprot:scaffold294216_cov33-Tisochrysis_lutea.AAC.1
MAIGSLPPSARPRYQSAESAIEHLAQVRNQTTQDQRSPRGTETACHRSLACMTASPRESGNHTRDRRSEMSKPPSYLKHSESRAKPPCGHSSAGAGVARQSARFFFTQCRDRGDCRMAIHVLRVGIAVFGTVTPQEACAWSAPARRSTDG